MGSIENGVGCAKRAVEFTINGVPYTVGSDIPPGLSLNFFIRDWAKLRGTKAMCREGGCGSCLVAAQIRDRLVAVNSCLVPVLICDGWAIKTIEGLGNKKDGYHSLQAALAHKNGTQCGYCSPAMVINAYSLLQGKQITMKELENSFGGNICRCTGYRPILETFKGFAVDATKELAKDIREIEDLYEIDKCKRPGQVCGNNCCSDCSTPDLRAECNIDIQLDGSEFHKVLSIKDLFDIFNNNPKANYVLNGGNTAHGVFRLKKRDMYIDINDIAELRQVKKDCSALTIGSNITLTMAIEIFRQYSSEKGYEYLQHLADHIDLMAGVPVRNIGTLAGNLMIKHEHRGFPSDLFLILETAGAQLHILDTPGRKTSMNLLDFLDYDMNHKLLYSIVLPPLGNDYIYRSFKIMPRAQNAHAIINAGFLFKVETNGNIYKRPNIIYGGINETFLHATETENFLVGKSIFDKDVVKGAMHTLSGELKLDHVLPDPSPEYRKTLAEGLFYKFLLGIRPENINSRIRSGGILLERGLSSGKQDFSTDKSLWPMNQPVPKLEAMHQTSGEAQYVNDIPSFPGEVFCAYVLTTVPNGRIANVDASEALKQKGVVAFITAKDVPGKNLFIDSAAKQFLLDDNEVLFADTNVQYAGQPIGVIVADTYSIAYDAAELVRVSYVDVKSDKAVLNLEEAVALNDSSRMLQSINDISRTRGSDVKHVIKDTFRIGSQYHFSMETQVCICVPIEDGMDVYSATQWVDLTQTSIAECLGVQENSLNISVRRLGGAYGSKISRATEIACACAVVAYKLNRPARFVLSLEDNMSAIGKRCDTLQEYEIGTDDDGRIQYLNSKHWSNAGSSFNEPMGNLTEPHFKGCYDSSYWSIQVFETKTDLPSNTFCRGPGAVEGNAMIENIMEHIAKSLGKDPVEVRLLNMAEVHKNMLQPMIEELSNNADFESRKKIIQAFNNENRWKKKGIALVPMMYPLEFFGPYDAHVAIYARDGTVAVTHGGIECGQGINTKVAQVAARTLGIDLSFVSVKPTNNLTAPNNLVTGGSITTESCAIATLKACQKLLKRLEPVRKTLKNPTWQELTMAAYANNVELCARTTFKAKTDIKSYPIYGVGISEVEIDVLTGQYMLTRVDLMEDVGISTNPNVDIGQVEGAFVMGIGYWTTEELIYDPSNGQLTNNRTWNYKPPGAKDIPVDFHVYFRRNAPNPFSTLRSKATGEPPFCLSYSIPIALRNAIDAARRDAGNNDAWYRLDAPITTERILLSCLTNKEQMLEADAVPEFDNQSSCNLV